MNTIDLFKIIFSSIASTGIIGIFILCFYSIYRYLFSESYMIRKLYPIMTGLLTIAAEHISRESGIDFRANVFYPRIKRGILQMLFGSKDFIGAGDYGISFKFNSGAVGYSWNSKKPIIADLRNKQIDFVSEWNMNPQQVERTKKLQSVLTIPIISENSNHDQDVILGILTFDSKNPKSYDLISQKKTIEIGYRFSTIIATLFEGVGLDPNKTFFEKAISEIRDGVNDLKIAISRTKD